MMLADAPTPSPAVCQLVAGAEPIADLAGLPPAMTRALDARQIQLSPAGGSFNASDVGPGPWRRFASAARLSDRYVMIYEHGGRGYHLDVLTYDGSPRAPRPDAVVHDVSMGKPPCEVLNLALIIALPSRAPDKIEW